MGRLSLLCVFGLLSLAVSSPGAGERMRVLIAEQMGPEGLIFTGFLPCGDPAFYFSVEAARVKPRSLRFLRTRLQFRPELSGVSIKIKDPEVVPSLEEIPRLFTTDPPPIELRNVTVSSPNGKLYADSARLLSCGTLVFLPGEWIFKGEGQRRRITLADWLMSESSPPLSSMSSHTKSQSISPLTE